MPSMRLSDIADDAATRAAIQPLLFQRSSAISERFCCGNSAMFTACPRACAAVCVSRQPQPAFKERRAARPPYSPAPHFSESTSYWLLSFLFCLPSCDRMRGAQKVRQCEGHFRGEQRSEKAMVFAHALHEAPVLESKNLPAVHADVHHSRRRIFFFIHDVCPRCGVIPAQRPTPRRHTRHAAVMLLLFYHRRCEFHAMITRFHQRRSRHTDSAKFFCHKPCFHAAAITLYIARRDISRRFFFFFFFFFFQVTTNPPEGRRNRNDRHVARRTRNSATARREASVWRSGEGAQ